MPVEREPTKPDREDVPSIKDLIRTELDGGKTVRQLAKDSGGRVQFQTFQNLSRHPPKEFPKDPKTITGMALALGVPETTVVLAYARSLGIGVTADSSFALRLPAAVDRLDPALQDALINLVRAATRTRATEGKGKGLRVNPDAPML